MSRYRIIVTYWSDHNRPHATNERTKYADAMKLWRRQCRAHQNADVILYSPSGHKMKSKDDSYPSAYGSNEPV